MVKIFLDPGHGGNDAGAVGNGLLEKDITLFIALEINRLLQNEYEGVSVQLSRTKDETVSLDERTDRANQWGADVYVAIHVNAGGGTGYEDYIYNRLDDDSATARIRDAIHEEVVKATGFRDRGKKKANFHVLRETAMPAVLTENGFIDREEDAGKLNDTRFLRMVARGHVNGLERALGLRKKPNAPNDPPPSRPDEGGGQAPSGSDLTRVIVDGTQVGAFAEKENVLRQVERYLGKAKYIVLERIGM
ncbi:MULTISPECIES: N-acetylmuramoyl-L-alanine amidase family protein [Geobacillus]|jgi:N-acetylmuramoyl-L-alanine amidase|uniref:N-acetylmuramoyl-L-alanine amidase n=1 Tax=Geobacillus thermoleovorans TaxID=33941 RepID=A0A2Z3N5J8_GEOTH|nr:MULTISPECIES: N-acetylmuramoyl-L-alanine amidase [Geobacillus]AWO74187.1 N-acetylmuramoyl-L-alanine amidase [Geobacillus thermoleovorans]KDE50492.1 N-acetylmuramoyl-L-alanine amidase [Geobacillus sp. CAMR5420]MBW7644724.1 N-acetylmuramoyl-L-alanine amidase [Geobacillus thermoleovorans]OQP10064.1 N-acetylmuramoyl-L-alanine amidase [Geobacillus thermoleovorans]QNU20509.1 N-acetylmuramoyl-L-alanine amidase [Geobacillus thermoleovorans]